MNPFKTGAFLFINKHNIKIVFTMMLFLFTNQNYITGVLLADVDLLCTIKVLSGEIISLPNEN